jgi:hypothetical protein
MKVQSTWSGEGLTAEHFSGTRTGLAGGRSRLMIIHDTQCRLPAAMVVKKEGVAIYYC